MNIQPYQNFQKTLQQFYFRITKDHPIKLNLKNRLKTLTERIDDDDRNFLPNLQLLPPHPKTKSLEEYNKPTQTISLRLLQPKEMTKETHTLSITKTRSILERSVASSKDLSEKGTKMFNCEWLFESEWSSKTLFYAIILAFLMNDNKLPFKYFEDKINDQLDDSKDLNEYELSSIAKQWQLIGSLLMKSKPLKWKQTLKESVNKLPLKFTKLACKTMLSLSSTPSDLFSSEILTKLSKQMKITVILFTITYKEIDSVETIGKAGQEIYIGKLKHKKNYVVSNQLPEYSQEDKILREIRANFTTSLNELLNQYNMHKLAIDRESNSKALREKEIMVKEFLTNSLSE